MSEWDKGFEAGLLYAKKAEELGYNLKEWAAIQSTVNMEKYITKISEAQQLITLELDRYKEELKNFYNNQIQTP